MLNWLFQFEDGDSSSKDELIKSTETNASVFITQGKTEGIHDIDIKCRAHLFKANKVVG